MQVNPKSTIVGYSCRGAGVSASRVGRVPDRNFKVRVTHTTSDLCRANTRCSSGRSSFLTFISHSTAECRSFLSYLHKNHISALSNIVTRWLSHLPLRRSSSTVSDSDFRITPRLYSWTYGHTQWRFSWHHRYDSVHRRGEECFLTAVQAAAWYAVHVSTFSLSPRSAKSMSFLVVPR